MLLVNKVVVLFFKLILDLTCSIIWKLFQLHYC